MEGRLADAAADPNIVLRSQMVAIRCRPGQEIKERYQIAGIRYRRGTDSPMTWAAGDFNHPDLAVARPTGFDPAISAVTVRALGS